jgi:hypothetical protein
MNLDRDVPGLVAHLPIQGIRVLQHFQVEQFVPRAFPLSRLFRVGAAGVLRMPSSSPSTRDVPATLRCLARLGSKVLLKPAGTRSPVSRESPPAKSPDSRPLLTRRSPPTATL